MLPLVLALTLVPLDAGRVRASVYVVNSTVDADDANPGDDICATVSARCTLRAAIEEANAHAGPDTIRLFSVGANVFTLTRALPEVGNGTTIEDPSVCTDLWVGAPPQWHNVLAGAGALFDGVRVSGGGSFIRGLEVTGFDRGIVLTGHGNSVQCSHAWGNQRDGIAAHGDDNVIGGAAAGNVTARNGRDGLHIRGNRIVVQGNFVGTSTNGMAAAANAQHGLYAETVVDLRIGGTSPGAGNLLAANPRDIEIRGGSRGALIEGCIVGLDRIAASSLSAGFGGTNISGGIFLTDATGTVIGGSSPAARNVIFGGHAPILNARGSTGTVIQGNYVGLSGDGQHVVGHTTGGAINDFGAGSLIEGNRIAGSRVDGTEQGLAADGTDGTIRGNWIGFYADGTFDEETAVSSALLLGGSGYTITGNVMGNAVNPVGFGSSIILMGGRSNTITNNIIGFRPDGIGPAPIEFAGVIFLGGAAENLIADNLIGHVGYAGIVLGGSPGFGVEPAGSGNALLRNRIVAYGSLAIDLSADPQAVADGMTPNDEDDSDDGPNELQNAPVLSSAVTTRAATRVVGSLRSIPNAAFRIEFFSGAANASGRHEVSAYLGFTTTTTNSLGRASFTASTLAPTLAGNVVTAIASRHHSGSSRFNSSELSPGVTVTVFGVRTPTPTRTATRTRIPTGPRTFTPAATATPSPTSSPSAPATATATSTTTPTEPASECTGDCDRNGAVTVDEVIRGVNIALLAARLDECVPFDENLDGAVSIEELIRAVRNLLAGCPD